MQHQTKIDKPIRMISKEDWAKAQYTGQWSDSPFNRDRVECGELPAYYIGRRNLMVNEHDGKGCKLITEGVHFLVENDYSNLPVLHKGNLLVGAAYQFAGGVTFVHRAYRLDEQYAKENELVYLDRVETSHGDFALPGGDVRADLRGGAGNV